jgi:hypothetical protein
MTGIKTKKITHPDDLAFADYMEGVLPAHCANVIERHIAECDECLAKVVAAHEAVQDFRKNKKGRIPLMKKINIYLLLAIVSFVLSFVTPRYFVQSLVATLVLGIKWIVDAKTTRTLVAIYDAWKSGGDREAGRALKELDPTIKRRF